MLGERDLDLDLLTRCDAAVKCPCAVKHLPYQRLVLVRDRVPEFPADQNVREVREHAHLRNRIHKIECEQEVGVILSRCVSK